MGIQPHGLTLRDLWPMYAGKTRTIRQQTIWQTSLIAAAFGDTRFDVDEFIRSGNMSDPRQRPVIMSEEMGRKVAVFQGCVRRKLPEPDFTDPDWEDKALAAFKAHDDAALAAGKK